MAVPPAPVRVRSHRPRKSRLSPNYKGHKRAVHKYPGIYFITEENPSKPQLGDRLMKDVRPVIASNGVPFLQMRSVGSQSTYGMEMEGKDR